MKERYPSLPLRASRDGLALSLLCAAGNLAAQQPTATEPHNKEAQASGTDLPEVVVDATMERTYKAERLQSPKFTEPLRDIPQTITVIPKTVIEDRGAFSLRDVLRNTPGISMQAGEGGGGLPGDNFSIRGFNSRSDLFIDGVRDSGSYNRDPFNLEQVEIAKGPSSTNSGRGSTGGSVNLVTKSAHLGNSYEGVIGVGTNDLFRSTFDFNQQIDAHTAMRVNTLYNYNDIAGRDAVNQERWGLAASLVFGLGTDTRVTLDYQFLQEDNLPEYGIPFVPLKTSTTVLSPDLEPYANGIPPVSFDNYYGRKGVDFEHVRTDIVTGIIEHDFSSSLHLRNITRFGRTHRDSIYTAPRFTDLDPGAGTSYNSNSVNRQMQAREMYNEYFTNQTNLTADFDTGPLKHSLVSGMELTLERQLSSNAALVNSITNLYHPNPDDPAGPTPVLPGFAESHMDTVAFYLFDTIKAGKHWEFSGGARYDHVEGEVGLVNGRRGFSNNDDLISYKLALIYKPVDFGSIYFGYGTSFNTSLDSGVTGVGGGLANAAQASLDPEETRSMELGTKWDLLGERLGLTAALFRTEKTNARATDPVLGTVLAGNQQVNGLELGLTGSITKDWQIFAGYAYMKGEVQESPNLAESGQTLGNTPDNTFNLWTTYNLPKNFQVGFGAQYVGVRRNGNNSTSRSIPDYWTCDAMLAYKVNDNLTLRLNVYNLADERYVDRVGGGHFTPGAGRSATLSASFKF